MRKHTYININKVTLMAMFSVATLAGCGDQKKAKNITAETNVDQTALYFIRTALQSGSKEIAAGKLAMQKASNARVKNFGAMMVHDHEQAANELIKISDKKLVTSNTGIMPQDKKTLDSLSILSGNDFDKAFMNVMIADHKKAITLHEGGSKNRISPVKAYAKKQLPALQMHLDSAQQISAAIATK